MSLESDAFDFIVKFEGFTPNAMFDYGAWRIGHGSDTITSPNGSYRRVVQGDVTTREMADNDLRRRVKNEFIPHTANQVGEPYWSKLPQPAQVALASLVYNYGSITKKAILDATKTGDVKKIAQAIIDSTYNDNASKPESVRNALRARSD